MPFLLGPRFVACGRLFCVCFFATAPSQALAAFGDGSIFIERYVKDPRHIEVQILGDGTGEAGRQAITRPPTAQLTRSSLPERA